MLCYTTRRSCTLVTSCCHCFAPLAAVSCRLLQFNFNVYLSDLKRCSWCDNCFLPFSFLRASIGKKCRCFPSQQQQQRHSIINVVRNCEQKKNMCVFSFKEIYIGKMTWRSRFKTYFLDTIHIFSYFNAAFTIVKLLVWCRFTDKHIYWDHFTRRKCLFIFFEISSSFFRIIYGKILIKINRQRIPF